MENEREIQPEMTVIKPGIRRSWTASPTKDVLISLVVYSGFFLIAPLILTKGLETVRKPGFLIPLLVAVVAVSLRTYYRPVAALAVIMLVYLHWRFDLSELGIRSRGWRGDCIAVLLVGLIYSIPRLYEPISLSSFVPGAAFLLAIDRMFANPATTTENLFYFGFLAERLSFNTGRWLTPLIIASMYTLQEMSNPEYWYEGMAFYLVFIGVALLTLIYLWRRSIVVLWLGDGLGRFVRNLF